MLEELNAGQHDALGLGRVAQQRRPAVYAEVSDELLAALVADPDLRERFAALHTSALAVLPLTLGDTALGTVTLGRGEGGFDPADLALAQEIAGRAAVSLDNTQLYAQAAHRGADPATQPAARRAPAGPRFHDRRAVPARHGRTGAGGDFYDVIALPARRVGLAIGNVVGHGIAAPVMGQLRAALRAYALEGHEPAAMLSRLNTVVHALGTGALTTCRYAV